MDLDERDEYGETPLVSALEHGDPDDDSGANPPNPVPLELAERLVTPNNINMRKSTGYTVLYSVNQGSSSWKYVSHIGEMLVR